MEKRTRVALVMPGVIALAFVAMAATKPYPESKLQIARDAADQWVDRNWASVPKTLDAISALPYVERQAMFNKMTYLEREGIWRAQFEAFVKPINELSETQRQLRGALDEGGKLSETQTRFILGLLDSLHSGYGAASDKAAREAYVRAVCDSVKKAALFSDRDHVRIFQNIGPIDTAYGKILVQPQPYQSASVAGDAEMLIQRAVVGLGLRAPTKPAGCNCLTGSPCACGWPFGGECTQTYPGCDPSKAQYLCGCYADLTCDGGQCFSGAPAPEAKAAGRKD